MHTKNPSVPSICGQNVYIPLAFLPLGKVNCTVSKSGCAAKKRLTTSSFSSRNTETLTVTLKSGKPTDLTFTLHLYGEVTVYPKGTARGSVKHLIGPDDAVSARMHSGSTVSSGYYRSASALRSVHSLSLSGSGSTTGTVVSLRSQITADLFSQTETDAKSAQPPCST